MKQYRYKLTSASGRYNQRSDSQDRLIMEERQPSCEEQVEASLESTLEDLRKLWEAYMEGEEEVEDLGSIYDYGLCFDYVAMGTFTDQDEPYFRYQLSYGGPSEEFRIYTGADFEPYRIEYWFLDWFDGASRTLYGEDLELLSEIFTNLFVESMAAENAVTEARDDFQKS